MTPEEVQAEIQKSVAAIGDTQKSINETLTKHEEHLTRLEKASERPEATDKHAAKMAELEKSLTDKEATLAGLQGELVKYKADFATRVEQIEELQKALQRSSGMPGAGDPPAATLGAKVIDLIKSNERYFKDYQSGAMNDARQLPATSRDLSFSSEPVFQGYTPEVVKALYSTPPTNLVAPYQVPGILPLLRRQILLRDLIPTVQSPMAIVINYLRQTGFSPAATPSSIAIVQTAGLATVTQAGHGYLEMDRVRVAGASQAGYNIDTYVHVIDANTWTYAVASGTVSPATGAPTAFRLNNFGAPTWIAESDTAPDSNIFYESRTAAIQTIAFSLKVGRNIMDDLPGLQASIDSDGVFGLRLNEDAAILYASGTGNSMAGLLTDPARQKYKWSQGKTGDTRAKAIRRARTVIELANGQASGCVLHPLDWEDIELETGSTGQYIWFNSQTTAAGAQQEFWKVPLVVTPVVAHGTAVLADFARASTLYDRMAAQVLWANQNEADFKARLLCALFEERMGHAVKRPELVVEVTLDNAPA